MCIRDSGSVWIVQVLTTNQVLTRRPQIPQRGSVWIVQVLSTNQVLTRRPQIPQRGSVWILQLLSTKRGTNPEAANVRRGCACSYTGLERSTRCRAVEFREYLG